MRGKVTHTHTTSGEEEERKRKRKEEKRGGEKEKRKIWKGFTEVVVYGHCLSYCDFASHNDLNP